MTTKYFMAVFADGTVLTRSSERKTYGFAWYARSDDGQMWSGFAGTMDNARKAAAAYARHGYSDISTAEAVEIDAKAYRAAKCPAGHPRRQEG